MGELYEKLPGNLPGQLKQTKGNNRESRRFLHTSFSYQVINLKFPSMRLQLTVFLTNIASN
jgi:hypothetical protein